MATNLIEEKCSIGGDDESRRRPSRKRPPALFFPFEKPDPTGGTAPTPHSSFGSIVAKRARTERSGSPVERGESKEGQTPHIYLTQPWRSTSFGVHRRGAEEDSGMSLLSEKSDRRTLDEVDVGGGAETENNAGARQPRSGAMDEALSQIIDDKVDTLTSGVSCWCLADLRSLRERAAAEAMAKTFTGAAWGGSEDPPPALGIIDTACKSPVGGRELIRAKTKAARRHVMRTLRGGGHLGVANSLML